MLAPAPAGGVTFAAARMAVEAAGQVALRSATGPSCAGLTGLGCSRVFPSLGVEAFRRVPPESRGMAVAAVAGFQDIAIGLTGPLLGGTAAVSRPASVFLVGAMAVAAGVLIVPRLRRASVLMTQAEGEDL